jgi:D-glycero-alpha-D-manno-heptose 1-phosphate guanylyltransferase
MTTKSNSIDAIVLAGGLGTRLREEVPGLPKPMAPVAGRPFLEHVLDNLDKAGVARVVLSVGHLAEKIIDHFGSSYKGMQVVYARETEPLGTGGAIAFALKHVQSACALVLNGDTYLDMSYHAFIDACTAEDAELGVVVRTVPDTSRFGRCSVDGTTLVQFCEKGESGAGFINAGVYYVAKDLFAKYQMPARFSFEQEFVAAHLAALRPLAFSVDSYFIDIGVPADFRKAQHDFAAREEVGRG